LKFSDEVNKQTPEMNISEQEVRISPDSIIQECSIIHKIEPQEETLTKEDQPPSEEEPQEISHVKTHQQQKVEKEAKAQKKREKRKRQKQNKKEQKRQEQQEAGHSEAQIDSSEPTTEEVSPDVEKIKEPITPNETKDLPKEETPPINQWDNTSDNLENEWGIERKQKAPSDHTSDSGWGHKEETKRGYDSSDNEHKEDKGNWDAEDSSDQDDETENGDNWGIQGTQYSHKKQSNDRKPPQKRTQKESAQVNKKDSSKPSQKAKKSSRKEITNSKPAISPSVQKPKKKQKKVEKEAEMNFDSLLKPIEEKKNPVEFESVKPKEFEYERKIKEEQMKIQKENEDKIDPTQIWGNSGSVKQKPNPTKNTQKEEHFQITKPKNPGFSKYEKQKVAEKEVQKPLPKEKTKKSPKGKGGELIKYSKGQANPQKSKKNKKHKPQRAEPEIPDDVVIDPVLIKEDVKVVESKPTSKKKPDPAKKPDPEPEDDLLAQLLREEEEEKKKKLEASKKAALKKQKKIDQVNQKIIEEELRVKAEQELAKKKKAEYRRNKRKKGKQNKDQNPTTQIPPKEEKKVEKQICSLGSERIRKMEQEAYIIEQKDKAVVKTRKKQRKNTKNPKNPKNLKNPSSTGPLTMEEIFELDKQKMAEEKQLAQQKKQEEYDQKMKPLLGMIGKPK